MAKYKNTKIPIKVIFSQILKFAIAGLKLNGLMENMLGRKMGNFILMKIFEKKN